MKSVKSALTKVLPCDFLEDASEWVLPMLAKLFMASALWQIKISEKRVFENNKRKPHLKVFLTVGQIHNNQYKKMHLWEEIALRVRQMSNENKLYRNTSVKTKKKYDILKPHSHREKGKLPSTIPLLQLLNPFPSRVQRSSESFAFLVPRCYTYWQCKCVPAPPPQSLISCRLTIAVSLLFPIRSREHGQRAGSFITATPVSPLQVSTSFSSKWPWNQLHNRGLRNPKQ